MSNTNDDGLARVNVSEIQEAEAAAFADQINKLLRHDEELKQRHILPITEPTPMVCGKHAHAQIQFWVRELPTKPLNCVRGCCESLEM